VTVYLDHHAASPPHAQVLERMRQAEKDAWANSSSVHSAGRRALALLEGARSEVADAVGVRPDRVVFTSGGTEACNLGVLGLARGATRVVTNGTEHPAVGVAVAALQERGVSSVRLSARMDDWPDEGAWARALPEPGALVAWQWVNHETGAIQPIARLAEICREHSARLFIDATQGLGKLPWQSVPASAWAIAGSKVGGPAGTGALVLAPAVEPDSRVLGGGQERGRRGGTPSVVGAVGLGAACLRLTERLAEMPRLAALRDRLEAALVELGCVVNGGEGERVATVVDVSVPRWRGDLLAAALDLEGLQISSGAACSSGVSAGSGVVRALYPDEPWRAESTLRASLGPNTTDADIEQATTILQRVIRRAGGT